MEFLNWHYTRGVQFYLDIWVAYFRWIVHYFSLTLLLQTLFAPWKRLVDNEILPGFHPMKMLESLTFNLVSRGIGAVVRIILFLVGGFLSVLVIFFGGLGLIFWLLLPILGLPVFLVVSKNPQRFITQLIEKLKQSKKDPFEVLFANEAGDFLLKRANISLDQLKEGADLSKINISELSANSFEELVKYLVEKKVWQDDFYRKSKLLKKDLILTASWWDRRRTSQSTIESPGYGRPGIGLELLFGYTPTLNRFSIDLGTPLSYSHRLIGREQVVLRMERTLAAGSNVLLLGQPGVGKKTVVLEFAHRAREGLLGPQMAFRRILEFDYNFLLSGSSDLNQKKTDLSQIFSEAANAGNVILMFRDIHRLTNSEVEGYDFTDIFENFLEKGDLKIIAVATPVEYERFVSKNLRLRKFLEPVEVTQPTREEAMQILIDSSEKWERIKNITITIPVLRKILEESDRYITETPFPEKAIELLDAVIHYAEQKGTNLITLKAVDTVLAEKTGVPFARLTKSEKEKLGKIEEIIHQRLIDQETAVNLIGKSLRAKVVGVTKENKPMGSFLFMGPTGVGKTETAKVLAKVYFGSTENILRFDMAEYAGPEGLSRLIGSVSKNQPGALTTAIKNRPASLLLLDELEKSSPEVYNLFLSLLDEGKMTDAFGRKISGRYLFIIGTSNAGAEYVRKLVSDGVSGEKLQKSVVNHVLEEGIYSPEFLNRFDGVIVYEPLRSEDLIKIARILLLELAKNLKKKGVLLEVTDDAVEKLAKDGYDPAFGARPMKRIISLILGDLFGRAILKGEIKDGTRVKIVPGQGKEEYSWEVI